MRTDGWRAAIARAGQLEQSAVGAVSLTVNFAATCEGSEIMGLS
jgi:uncharacterized membrane protein